MNTFYWPGKVKEAHLGMSVTLGQNQEHYEQLETPMAKWDSLSMKIFLKRNSEKGKALYKMLSLEGAWQREPAVLWEYHLHVSCHICFIVLKGEPKKTASKLENACPYHT